MANFLVLNQPQVFVGLGTLTYTVPTTGQYSVVFQTTVPEAVATGDGAGSGTGLGSGSGGGDTYGFAGGGAGTSHGAVGQGFGASPNNYQQPPAYGSNETSGPAVTSSLVVVVKNGASTIYTAPTLTATQSAYQFNFGFQATAADVITVVLTSANANDTQLNSVKSTVAIQQGF